MIMNAEDPSNKWLLYPINIIENSTFSKLNIKQMILFYIVGFRYLIDQLFYILFIDTYEEAVKRERQNFISASESERGDPNIEKRKICNLNYESDGKECHKCEQFLLLNLPKYGYRIF